MLKTRPQSWQHFQTSWSQEVLETALPFSSNMQQAVYTKTEMSMLYRIVKKNVTLLRESWIKKSICSGFS